MPQSLYKQMVDIIRALGVEAVPTTGTPFDPSIHDGIMREPSSEHPDGTVLMEFRKGFRIKDRLLRPAMVKVRTTRACSLPPSWRGGREGRKVRHGAPLSAAPCDAM